MNRTGTALPLRAGPQVIARPAGRPRQDGHIEADSSGGSEEFSGQPRVSSIRLGNRRPDSTVTAKNSGTAVSNRKSATTQPVAVRPTPCGRCPSREPRTHRETGNGWSWESSCGRDRRGVGSIRERRARRADRMPDRHTLSVLAEAPVLGAGSGSSCVVAIGSRYPYPRRPGSGTENITEGRLRGLGVCSGRASGGRQPSKVTNTGLTTEELPAAGAGSASASGRLRSYATMASSSSIAPRHNVASRAGRRTCG